MVLARRHIWLAEKPVQSLHQGVWDLVCVVAVDAMDRSRAYLYKKVMAGNWPGPELGAAAVREVVAEFFENLADFCGLKLAPAIWEALIPADHPFSCFLSYRYVYLETQSQVRPVRTEARRHMCLRAFLPTCLYDPCTNMQGGYQIGGRRFKGGSEWLCNTENEKTKKKHPFQAPPPNTSILKASNVVFVMSRKKVQLCYFFLDLGLLSTVATVGGCYLGVRSRVT